MLISFTWFLKYEYLKDQIVKPFTNAIPILLTSLQGTYPSDPGKIQREKNYDLAWHNYQVKK